MLSGCPFGQAARRGAGGDPPGKASELALFLKQIRNLSVTDCNSAPRMQSRSVLIIDISLRFA
jgi:hypothetical protein